MIEKTEEIVGRESSISPKTVRRKAEFDKAVDKLSPEERKEVAESNKLLPGARYNIEKLPEGGYMKAIKADFKISDTVTSRTVDRLAEEYGVSPSCIERDGAFAAAVDKLSSEERKEVLEGILLELKVGLSLDGVAGESPSCSQARGMSRLPGAVKGQRGVHVYPPCTRAHAFLDTPSSFCHVLRR